MSQVCLTEKSESFYFLTSTLSKTKIQMTFDEIYPNQTFLLQKYASIGFLKRREKNCFRHLSESQRQENLWEFLEGMNSLCSYHASRLTGHIMHLFSSFYIDTNAKDLNEFQMD